MKKFLLFFILFKIIFSYQYTYIRKNYSDPLAQVPLCIGNKRENIKCHEIPIDLTYSYILLSPKDYIINDNSKREEYTQEFINYNYYFYKGIKSETIYFLNSSNCYKQLDDDLHWIAGFKYIKGFQDVNKIGLGACYKGQDEVKELEDNNFVFALYRNSFIKDLTFSFEPKSKTETIITFGEKITQEYKKCYSSNKLKEIINNGIEEKNLWNCPLNKIAVDNSDVQFLKGENNYAIFDSISEDIQLPYETGIEILNYINEKTGNKCYFEETKFNGPSQQEFSYSYLICRPGVDVREVPDIKFIFENFELNLGKNVLLRPHDCCRNRVNILAYKNLKYIKIGVPILKKYHIIFDYLDNSVGIIQDKSYIFIESKMNNINFYNISILFIKKLNFIINKQKNILVIIIWGLGIGDWGLGIGD